MTAAATTAGVDGFIAGLRVCGSRRRGGLGHRRVHGRGGGPVRPAHHPDRRGRRGTRGLAGGPAALGPPSGHGAVHRTNISPAETLPGWVRHSREIKGWGDAEEPAQAWLAHLRRVLQDAA